MMEQDGPKLSIREYWTLKDLQAPALPNRARSNEVLKVRKQKKKERVKLDKLIREFVNWIIQMAEQLNYRLNYEWALPVQTAVQFGRSNV